MSPQTKLKYVYHHNDPLPVNTPEEKKAVYGGKGAGLFHMLNQLSFPVPKFINIITQTCLDFQINNNQLPKGLRDTTLLHLTRLEKDTGKSFGDPNNPLLVSCRSGARVSMPGMMDSILNVGLNRKIVQALGKKVSMEYALDLYRRLIQMFGASVKGIDGVHFEKALEEILESHRVEQTHQLSVEGWQSIVDAYENIYCEHTGENEFPQDVYDQLFESIPAVFKSWFNPEAIALRKKKGISDNTGTAVNIVEMVYGNIDQNSATGVVFSRNKQTGQKGITGDVLFGYQGEAVVSGESFVQDLSVLKTRMPKVYKQLKDIVLSLELDAKEMVDVEFTIEQGKLYILQYRIGERTAQAAVKIAVDMQKEGLLTKKQVFLGGQITPERITQLHHPVISQKYKGENKADLKGIGVSFGAGWGKVVFTVEESIRLTSLGEQVVLVAETTNPKMYPGMKDASAFCTRKGGPGSHAGIVAAGHGIPCAVGVKDLIIRDDHIILNGKVVKEGEYITVDGFTGQVYVGKVPTKKPPLPKEYFTLMNWGKEIRKNEGFGVRANADDVEGAKKSMEFGFEGTGLYRIEHALTENEQIFPSVEDMILAVSKEKLQASLDNIEDFLTQGLYDYFLASVPKGSKTSLPTTIRLIDPPLHEFLSDKEDVKKDLQLAKEKLSLEKDNEELQKKVDFLELMLAAIKNMHEDNPMLGLRGVRLGILRPEITKMQSRAIFTAAAKFTQDGYFVQPEIMVPLVAGEKELVHQLKILRQEAKAVMEKYQVDIKYLLGTMIELPRACLIADKLAIHLDFISFGTNDLTQTTIGLSRDDTSAWMPSLIEQGIWPHDHFQSLDIEGVGELVTMAVNRARSVNPDIKIGICGEHGGDPVSIEFFYSLGFHYVSCSPYKIPGAQIAATIAILKPAAVVHSRFQALKLQPA